MKYCDLRFIIKSSLNAWWLLLSVCVVPTSKMPLILLLLPLLQQAAAEGSELWRRDA